MGESIEKAISKSTRIGELEAELSESRSAHLSWKADAHRLESALAAAQSRIAELERMVVWAVRHGASEGYDGNSSPCIWYSATRLICSETYGRAVETACERDIEIDGTSASILAAVKKAMGER